MNKDTFLTLKEGASNETTNEIIPEEIKRIPLFDIHLTTVDWPFNIEDELAKHSEKLNGWGVVRVNGQEKDDEDSEIEKYISTGELEVEMNVAARIFSSACEDYFNVPVYKAWISDSIAVYGLDKDIKDLILEIGQAMNELDGPNYFYGFDWTIDTAALFRVRYDDEDAKVFYLNEGGWFEKFYDNGLFEKLLELTMAGLNKPNPVDIEAKKNKPEKFYPQRCCYNRSGIACVLSRNGKYGFIDQNGTLVKDCIYDYAIGYYNALESYEDEVNRIDHHGCYSKDYKDPCEEIATVKKDGKWGFIDAKGDFIVDCIYDDAYRFYEGVANVVKDGRSFKIDIKGNEL